MKEQQTLMIGIGGVSRAGKTELSKFLEQKFKAKGVRVVVIQQDDHVIDKNKIPTIRERVDWESPESIDHQSYRQAIFQAKQKGAEVIISEGLLNFYDDSMIDLFDKKIFMEISRATFEKRKAEDTRWGHEPNWYIDHIWESYEKYGRSILNTNTDFLHVFGENHSAYESVWEYVNSDKLVPQR